MIPCEFCNGEHVVIERTTVEYFQITPKVIDEVKEEGWFKKAWKKKN